jgi:hypothetical protein
VLDIVIALRSTGSEVLSPNREKKFEYFPKRQEWLRGPSSRLFNEYLGYFLEVKSPGGKVEDSHPTRAEIKKVRAILLLPPVCFRSINRYKFTSH